MCVYVCVHVYVCVGVCVWVCVRVCVCMRAMYCVLRLLIAYGALLRFRRDEAKLRVQQLNIQGMWTIYYPDGTKEAPKPASGTRKSPTCPGK